MKTDNTLARMQTYGYLPSNSSIILNLDTWTIFNYLYDYNVGKETCIDRGLRNDKLLGWIGGTWYWPTGITTANYDETTDTWKANKNSFVVKKDFTNNCYTATAKENHPFVEIGWSGKSEDLNSTEIAMGNAWGGHNTATYTPPK